MKATRKNLRAENYVQTSVMEGVHATYATPCHLWHKWHLGASDPFSMPLMPLLSIRQEWKWHGGQAARAGGAENNVQNFTRRRST